MVDQMIIFNKYYTDYMFNGSVGLKSVLPIICSREENPKDSKISLTSSEIKENNNIEIHKHLKSINSYDLLKFADVVIGKPSTILEEAMSAGKEVIIYDDDNYLSSINYIYGELGVIEKDYKGLEKRVKDIIEGKYDPSNKIKNFVKKYYCNNTNNNGFDLIKEQISSCLQG